ncbi:MAG TPA: sigma-54 dependent transcriptional regulator [Granulicella sp.]|jgi:DNA-binding NtrC family response regulator|nr:sigma-54 dependent transcriptional regulator [Granulicella sp.]
MTASSQRLSTASAKHPATVLITSPDTSFRQKVKGVLEGLRWRVEEASGGAEALLYLNNHDCVAMILDSWLPDLEVSEFIAESRRRYPATDVLMQNMSILQLAAVKNSRRQELWYALRCSDAEGDRIEATSGAAALLESGVESQGAPAVEAVVAPVPVSGPEAAFEALPALPEKPRDLSAKLPEIVGSSPAIIELCRQIRLVAPKKTSVLIQGPTGTGKELVACAVHRLSKRSRNSFIVVNCAAIPETLLEAELFGHTKGAFTGAVQARLGRLEAAHGGTLFLDEIGEMPLMLQSKLLRFLEAGELQRIGENKPIHVDVRVIAATHQPLEQRAAEGSFRSDLYFRLSVFPLVTPSLAERRGDIPELAEHFLRRFAIDQPVKRLHASGMERLMAHSWPGGVRELEHVLERGYILAEDRSEIAASEIRFGSGR